MRIASAEKVYPTSGYEVKCSFPKKGNCTLASTAVSLKKETALYFISRCRVQFSSDAILIQSRGVHSVQRLENFISVSTVWTREVLKVLCMVSFRSITHFPVWFSCWKYFDLFRWKTRCCAWGGICIKWIMGRRFCRWLLRPQWSERVCNRQKLKIQ